MKTKFIYSQNDFHMRVRWQRVDQVGSWETKIILNEREVNDILYLTFNINLDEFINLGLRLRDFMLPESDYL